jgi:2-hydroxychromene-2-carboxylate isomerase/rhodanese-related sulfurtransferase
MKRRTLFVLCVVLILAAIGVLAIVRFPRVPRGVPSKHIWGPLNALVVVTLYGDIEERATLEAYRELRRLAETFPLSLSLEYRHFQSSPLTRWGGARATELECATRVGKFWHYLDVAYASLGEAVSPRDFPSKLVIAPEFLASCRRDRAVKATVEADRADAQARGIVSAPAVLINGTRFDGVIRFETLRAVATDLFSQGGSARYVPIMGAEELWERFGGRIPPVVVDIRDTRAFIQSHIRAAQSLPITDVEKDRAALEQLAREHASTPFLVVVGDDSVVVEVMEFLTKSGVGVVRFEGMEAAERLSGFPLEGRETEEPFP